MWRDFTYRAFEAFCQAAAGKPVFTVDNWLARIPPPTPAVLLRFDIDYREPHALQLARVAARWGLHGSFYFRHHRDGFALDTMRAVACLGHEVGYHFETLDLCRGDFEQAEALFISHIADLRAAGFEIRTAAAHGALPTAPTYQNNLDLLARKPELLEQVGLLGETTLSIDFGHVVYISDALWRWRQYDHYSPGSRHSHPTCLREIVTALEQADRALYLNFHPHQWFPNQASLLYYRTRSRVGQRIMPLVRRAAAKTTERR